MKKLFIAANWKSHKTFAEVKEWLLGISNFKFPISNEKEIIVCPPFLFISDMQNAIIKQQLSLKLGAQNLSPFGEGAYTGEVNAQQLTDIVSYVIVGHSERRNYFGETDALLKEKVKLTLSFNLTPIFCIQGKETPVPEGVTLVAYEPVNAIGTGQADTPEDAEDVANFIKQKYPHVQYILYGGSVTPDNVLDFTKMPEISGVLVGGASLDAEKFLQIIERA